MARDRDNPDLRRKAMTSITAKMARVVHAVIEWFRLPTLHRGADARWKDLCQQSREGITAMTL